MPSWLASSRGTGLEPLDGLARFRTGLYAAFGRRRDALFELVDALLTAGPAPSLVHLSLAPVHRRGWGSVYAALRRGQVDADALRALLLRQPRCPGPPVFAVDVSVWPRRDAETSPERGFHYSSPCRRTGSAIVRGWAYQWVAQLSPGARQLDGARRRAARAAHREGDRGRGRAGARPRRAPAPAPPAEGPPLFVFDAGYDAAHFTLALADTPVALLIRLRSNRCFCADLATGPQPAAPQAPAERGQVRLQRPGHLARPDRRAALRGRRLRARRRAGLGRAAHQRPQPPPAGRYRPAAPRPRDRPARAGRPAARAPAHARDSSGCGTRARAARTCPPPPRPGAPLAGVLPEIRPGADLPIPEADAWAGSRRGCACRSRPTAGPGSCAAAYTQLRLARGAVADHRLPWERPLPPAALTPGAGAAEFCDAGRVAARRSAAPPRPCGRSPGAPKGAARRRRRAIHPSRRPPERHDRGVILLCHRTRDDLPGRRVDCRG